jgi:hypothetical protein
MKKLTGNDTVYVWEEGESREPWYKAVKILSYAFPGVAEKELMEWSIGRRNTCLLELRRLMFYSPIESFLKCPGCLKQIGYKLNARDIGKIIPPGMPIPPMHDISSDREFSLTLEDVDIRFRPLDSRDLEAVDGSGDAAVARRRLIERAVIRAVKDDKDLDVIQLPDSIMNTLREKMSSDYDPGFEIRLALECPFCGHKWAVCFDILTFLWTEIKKQAQDLLQEVHTLAGAYGWSEKDILDMSAARRQYYLDLQA